MAGMLAQRACDARTGIRIGKFIASEVFGGKSQMNFEKLGRFRRAYRTLLDENHRGTSVKESRNIKEASDCALKFWLVVRRSCGF